MLRYSLDFNSSILLLGCLNPNEVNFEDCLNSLTHLDRCKNYEEVTKLGMVQEKSSKEEEED